MKRVLTSLLIVGILLIMSIPHQPEQLEIQEAESSAEGRQVDGEVNCTGYKFEDLFVYDFANFNIEINEDWASGQYEATAFANDSNAASVRKDLDGLFDGFPGGNNTWISSDERDAVRAIGPQCVSDMETRMAITEGFRSRDSRDLNNVSFYEDGIALDEENLIPEDNPDKRRCTNLGASSSCQEVPVSATENLEIDLTLADEQDKNVEFIQLPNRGVSNFTMTINVTAMIDADVRLVFPPTNGLRLNGFDVLDNGLESSSIASPTTQYLGDGSLEVLMDVVYDLDDLPMERYVYLDFTTEEPQFNTPPLWTSSSPSSGNIFMYSGMEGNEFTLLSGDNVQTWGTDDQGWNLNCSFTEQGWSLTQNQEFDMVVTRGDSTTAQMECGLVDQYGLTTDETRTWTIGIPFSLNGSYNSDTSMADIQLTDSGLASDYSVALKAVQGETSAEIVSVVISSDLSISLLTDGLSPGEFMISSRVTGDNIIPWNFIYDLDMELPNTPPSIVINTNLEGQNGTWNAQNTAFSMSGTVVDLEGESVTMTWSLCGGSSSSFIIQGNTWETEVSIITCVQQGIEEYNVVISASDESGLMSTERALVTDGEVDSGQEPVVLTEEPEDGLPSIGIAFTVISIALASLVYRRKD